MKAGFVALAAGALVGSVLATPHGEKRDYDWPSYPASSSSVSKAPIKPSSSSYYAASSTSSYYEEEEEDCTSSGLASASAYKVHGTGYSHSRKAKPSSTGAPVVKPAYFDYGCCGTVVTTTVYATMPSKPSAPASVPVKPVETSKNTVTVYTTVTPVSPIPTPAVTVCPTPGVYEFPAVTIHLNRTITVVAKKSTSLTPGANFYGGYTTTVNASTTVTCPYATLETSGTVVTEVVKETTYVCPSAGVYTPVAPQSTTVSTSTVLVYPVPTTYCPGDYTAAATTVTATVTNQVIVCPIESVTVTSTYIETVQQVKTTAAVVTASAAKETYPAYSPPAAVSSSAPAPAKPSSGVKVNGKKWAMTYTPYTSGGQCKSASEVDADIAIIAGKGFTTVRLYATDCSGLVNVGAACKAHSMKLIVGVFIKAAGIDDAKPQVDDIVKWGQGGMWEIVSMIVIGNEAIFNGYCTSSELAGFISYSKAKFSAAGYSGPVTTTEPLNKLQESGGDLCGVIDVVAANIQPFFNSGVEASSAGTFVAGQLQLVGQVCPGKEAYNLECGWPNNGNANGAAQPGQSQQAAAIADIVDKVGDHTVVFSYDNDSWKSGGAFGVEQFFGCASLF